ncbi:unnamed protein product [Rotaria sp. Silwood1]|nr:unnamed protein product [Rotaria sp. Silwood1]
MARFQAVLLIVVLAFLMIGSNTVNGQCNTCSTGGCCPSGWFCCSLNSVPGCCRFSRSAGADDMTTMPRYNLNPPSSK